MFFLKETLLNLVVWLRRFPVLSGALKFFVRSIFRYFFSRPNFLSDKLKERTCLSDDNNHVFFGYYDRSPSDITIGKLISCYKSNDSSWNSGLGQSSIYISTLNTHSQSVFLRSEWITNTYAWNTQQGSLCSWLSPDSFIFNDLINPSCNGFEESRAVVANLALSSFTRLPISFQALSPDASRFCSIPILQLSKLRKDYGYMNLNLCQDNSLDVLQEYTFSSNKVSTLVTYDDVCKLIPSIHLSKIHKFNHCCYSPDSTRLAFMSRFIDSRGKHSYLFCLDLQDLSLSICHRGPIVSHYCWVSNDSLMVWGSHPNFGSTVTSNSYSIVSSKGELLDDFSDSMISSLPDGHPSLHSSGRYIITDTYQDIYGQQHLYLIDLNLRSFVCLASFNTHLSFSPYTRTDLHPRFLGKSNFFSIDIQHVGRLRSHQVFEVLL